MIGVSPEVEIGVFPCGDQGGTPKVKRAGAHARRNERGDPVGDFSAIRSASTCRWRIAAAIRLPEPDADRRGNGQQGR